jgi:glycosyltransferase involved in cell wall biosynthesis
MMKRVNTLFKYPTEKTKLILPSISHYSKANVSDTFNHRLSQINSSHFNVLMLTGWHKNKNIEIVPFVLKELKILGIADVNFVITVPPFHPNSIKLKKMANELSVIDHIIFFDTVQPHEVPMLIENIDAFALLSLLESFSNNIIEAWYFKKALFISNEEWAKGICKKSAIYVNRNDSKNIAKAILNYRANIELQKKLIAESELMLKNYPTPQQKVVDQVNFIKNIIHA